MKQWEYKIIETRDAKPTKGDFGNYWAWRDIETHLNNLGGEGWELLAMKLWDGKPESCLGVAKRERRDP